MDIFQAIDLAVDKLTEDGIDQTQYFDTIEAKQTSEGPPHTRPGSEQTHVLNVNAVRLVANIAGISITEVKVLREPKFNDEGKMVKSEYVVSATAQIRTMNGNTFQERKDTAIFSEPTHLSNGEPNPNFREVAISMAKRNAMRGLIPEKYFLDKLTFNRTSVELKRILPMAALYSSLPF